MEFNSYTLSLDTVKALGSRAARPGAPAGKSAEGREARGEASRPPSGPDFSFKGQGGLRVTAWGRHGENLVTFPCGFHSCSPDCGQGAPVSTESGAPPSALSPPELPLPGPNPSPLQPTAPYAAARPCLLPTSLSAPHFPRSSSTASLLRLQPAELHAGAPGPLHGCACCHPVVLPQSHTCLGFWLRCLLGEAHFHPNLKSEVSPSAQNVEPSLAPASRYRLGVGDSRSSAPGTVSGTPQPPHDLVLSLARPRPALPRPPGAQKPRSAQMPDGKINRASPGPLPPPPVNKGRKAGFMWLLAARGSQDGGSALQYPALRLLAQPSSLFIFYFEAESC